MKDEEVLVVGAYGQLGKALVARYPGARAVDRDELDITDEKALEAFDWNGITTILNAAAYTNVDGAETMEGRRAVWKINAQAVANLARVAVKRDLVLVHISSDYVFDGTRKNHAEDESFAPLSTYGAAKAAGDVAVSVAPKHYIVRPEWLIGDGPNFVRTMIGLAAKNISPKVVQDQMGRLTFTTTLVDGIVHLLEKPAPFGTYHLTNSGDAVSWAEVTRTIFKELGRDDLTVTGITTAEYFKDKPEAAIRPLDSSFDLSRIEATGFNPADWREMLHEYIEAEQAGKKEV
jgi:dTDP-4-dehydrorhamnose 3,5-epimerase/reductase